MLRSRRGFLIGAGAVLTAAFVKDVSEFVQATGEPLLVKQSEVRHTLYWYLPKGSNAPVLCLNGSPFIVPPAPTWREFLSDLCTRLYRTEPQPKDVDMWRRHYEVEPEQLDGPVDSEVWQREQDLWLSPQARAYSLLQSIHFGPDLGRSYHPNSIRQHPHIEFRWTSRIGVPISGVASDLVALSLLQARLIEIGKPIKILKG